MNSIDNNIDCSFVAGHPHRNYPDYPPCWLRMLRGSSSISALHFHVLQVNTYLSMPFSHSPFNDTLNFFYLLHIEKRELEIEYC